MLGCEELQIINKKSYYEHFLVEKYQKKGCNFFYIGAKDYPAFIEFSVSAVVPSLLRGLESKAVSSEDKHELLIASHQVIHKLVDSIGFTPMAQNLANSAINSTIETLQLVGRSKESGNLFSKIKKMLKKGDFVSEHSCLVSYIITAMTIEINWCSEVTLRKYVVASFLHDIALKSPDLAKVRNLDQLYALTDVTEEDRSNFMNHPEIASQMITDLQELPPDIDTIIAQHHERPDGKGFPRGLSALRVAPLSAVFIIAEEFALRLYECQFDENQMMEIVMEMKNKYNAGNYRRGINALIKSIMK
ncbi:MAG: HD domain-containing protein [Bacteriovoracaceae bacterium]|nr:HD domain-containing protein [Bacteriovoracaceae bacterium]